MTNYVERCSSAAVDVNIEPNTRGSFSVGAAGLEGQSGKSRGVVTAEAPKRTEPTVGMLVDLS